MDRAFATLPLWTNLLIFVIAAGVVWFAGARLARYAEVISERTGMGKAFIGALMLGGITSLPEVVTTGTAAAIGNAPLAANNIFGGVAMQVAVLVLADAMVPDRALSLATAHSGVLLQGALLVLVLALAATGILIGEPAGLPFGLWTPALFVSGGLGFWLIHHYETDIEWEPTAGEAIQDADERERANGEQTRHELRRALPLRRAVLYSVAAGAAIVAAGFVVAQIADALAEQTGLGSSFVGVALLPIATSLPEISTTVAAARLGQFEMAFSNVYGANLLDVGVLFIVDVIYAGGPVLNELGKFSIFGALLGIVTTTVYLAGLIERRNRTILGLGVDSLVVLVCYLAGLGVLFALR
jgi:cation:H+ antiporter